MVHRPNLNMKNLDLGRLEPKRVDVQPPGLPKLSAVRPQGGPKLPFEK